MTTIAYHLVSEEDGEQTLTVFIPGETPSVISSEHAERFDDILAELNEPDPDEEYIRDLADASRAVARYLNPLSERVAVSNGHVYFDGDEVNSTLTDHILRVLDNGADDWMPLVKFMENLASNPVDHTKHRLYGWLDARDFTITDDGCFIAYKGVRRDNAGVPRSIHSGRAIVDGEEHTSGGVPNEVGSTIEFPRSEVEHNPSVGCSTGLHAGTYEYASHYGDVLLTVKVNPRDVVSVPTDSGDAKVRTCRYEILDVAGDAPLAEPIVKTEEVSQLGG